VHEWVIIETDHIDVRFKHEVYALNIKVFVMRPTSKLQRPLHLFFIIWPCRINCIF